ncbi:MAG: hypothetical protein R6V14_04280 [Halanaerobiales bacterium]
MAVVKVRMSFGEVPREVYEKIKSNTVFDVNRIKEIEEEFSHDRLVL